MRYPAVYALHRSVALTMGKHPKIVEYEKQLALPAAVNGTEPPELVYIAVSELRIDRRYQRGGRASTMRKMRKHGWDWTLVGGLNINRRRDGEMAVMDGSHRVLFSIECEVTALPCALNFNLDLRAEAMVFCNANEARANPQEVEFLEAMATAGDHDAMRMIEIIKRHGFETGPFSKLNVIGCGSAIERAYFVYGYDALDKTISLIRKVWDGRAEGSTGYLVLGLARFIRLTNPTQRVLDRIAGRLTGRRLSELRIMFAHLPSEPAIAMAICELYNHGLRNDRIDPMLLNTSAPIPLRDTNGKLRGSKSPHA